MHRHQSSNSLSKKSSDDVARATNLASKLGDEDVEAESVAIVGKVVDEIIGRSTIIVNSDSIVLGKQSLARRDTKQRVKLLTVHPEQAEKKVCIHCFPDGALVQAGVTKA